MSARDDADTILHLLTFVHALVEATGSDISEIEMLAPPLEESGEPRRVSLQMTVAAAMAMHREMTGGIMAAEAGAALADFELVGAPN